MGGVDSRVAADEDSLALGLAGEVQAALKAGATRPAALVATLQAPVAGLRAQLEQLGAAGGCKYNTGMTSQSPF